MRLIKVLGFSALLLAGPAWSGQGAGKVQTIFMSATGDLAFSLSDNAFGTPASQGCSTSNGYAGLVGMDSTVKAAILAAKAAGQTVTVVTNGCESGGIWYKISQLYFQ